VVVCLAILDFSSTYFLLELSNKNNAFESGIMAVWALDRGGFSFLFVFDIVAATVLSLAAFGAKYLFFKRGFKSYGRAAFVFLLAPYVIIATVAIINNLILLFF
jgi:hypothetical protein